MFLPTVESHLVALQIEFLPGVDSVELLQQVGGGRLCLVIVGGGAGAVALVPDCLYGGVGRRTGAATVSTDCHLTRPLLVQIEAELL